MLELAPSTTGLCASQMRRSLWRRPPPRAWPQPQVRPLGNACTHLSSMRARLTAQHPSSHNTKDAFSFRAVRAMFVASAPSKHSEANDLTECLSCWCRHSNVCGADFLFITHPRMAHCGNCGANRCARGCGRCARHADHQEAAAGEAQGGCCGTGPAEGAMSVSLHDSCHSEACIEGLRLVMAKLQRCWPVAWQGDQCLK